MIFLDSFNKLWFSSEIGDRQDLALHEDRRVPVRPLRLLHERDPTERDGRQRTGNHFIASYSSAVLYRGSK